MKKKLKRFSLKFTSEELYTGNRKTDSNYYRRKIKSKKIAYIHSLIKNINQLIIIASFTLPELKTGLIDRFLILAERFGVTPFIIFTKSDLVDLPTIHYYKNIYQTLGYSVVIVSNVKKTGIKKCTAILKNNDSALIGHSGVGKTTLLNHIDPNYNAKTQTISSFTKRGRHTTTTILRHELQIGGVVYDLPGLKELDFVDVNPNEVKNYYREFNSKENPLQCQYKNCTHSHEPECEVKLLVEKGLIHPERYQNYLNIFASIES